jgi:tetratricopeptide (TPR) repeat protein
MGFFGNLFGNKNTSSQQKRFSEGDLFYTKLKEQFHVFKLLRDDKTTETFHVMCYEPVPNEPDALSAGKLRVMVWHAPIASNGFPGAKFLCTSTITKEDLQGYFEYLKRVNFQEYCRETGQNLDEMIKLANASYTEAYYFTDQKKYTEAIAGYTKAYELFPLFFEAVDNRAFCKMDLAKWEEAIDDFQLSLTINPRSVLAEFSIGECYLKMGKYSIAKTQFEKTLEIDPDHQLSKDFLARTINLMK